MLGCIQPISSPMMKRMLGLACCCCAAVGVLAAVTAANDTNRPSQMFLAVLMVRFLGVGCPRRGPAAFAPIQRTDRVSCFVPIHDLASGIRSDALSIGDFVEAPWM